jgi:hypothetical protein
MEWRIRECSDGRFVAELGTQISGGELAPSGVGVTMPAFIVYEAMWFETRRKAEGFIKRRAK